MYCQNAIIHSFVVKLFEIGVPWIKKKQYSGYNPSN